jgi:predicted permease
VTLVARLATAIARAALLLYPPSFRRDVGRALTADVARRAHDRAGWRGAVWLVRLAASLMLNAAAAWRDEIAWISWLDIKLAFRMLVKYPGLTLTGGLGIAVAVAIGVGFFALFHSRFYPAIPLPDGNRIVALENRDRQTTREERRSLYDFGVWRTDVRSVEDLTAFRTVTRNVIAEDDSVDVAQVAEITPSGFRLVRVPPALGRALVESDAASGAPPVIVIGFDVWRRRFAFNAGVVGREIRLDRAVHTIVGVMPDGFAFPVNHEYWIPLSGERATPAPRTGPSVFIAGRLAPGIDPDAANAELAAIGQRMAATLPETHAHLRPKVLPYTYPFAGMTRSSSDEFWLVSALASLILVVVCVNIAILIYARTATRLQEITVRSALGASRARVVGQLFAESFLLAAAATAAGLLVVKAAFDWTSSSLMTLEQSNFWDDYTLTGTAVVYGVVLMLIASAIMGLVPALRVTRRKVLADLRGFASGTGLRLGRTWTTLIAVQVSVASAALPIAIGLGWFQVRDIFNLPTFATDQILFAEVRFDREAGGGPRVDAAGLGARFEILKAGLAERLKTEPGVMSHTFTLNYPNLGGSGRIAIENDPSGLQVTRDIQPSTVDAGFFRTFDLTLLAGREFNSGDSAERAADVVIVNRAFVSRWLDGDQPLGRRLRFVHEPAAAPRDGGDDRPPRWCQIVGVVENIDANPFGQDLVSPRVYRPIKYGLLTNARLALRVPSNERGALARKLPAIAAGIDPAFQVDVIPLDEVYRLQRIGLTTAAIGIGVALLSVILLSAAGIYALMSFTVAQRRREIAIRAALGAQPGRLVRGVFARAVRPILIGVIAGVGAALLIDLAAEREPLAGRSGSLLMATVFVMSGVGLAAAIGPARRGLRIDPVTALKVD